MEPGGNPSVASGLPILEEESVAMACQRMTISEFKKEAVFETQITRNCLFFFCYNSNVLCLFHDRRTLALDFFLVPSGKFM